MNDTFFYIFGIALVVSAVVISVIGLRFESFPSNRGVLAAVVGYFAVLVGLTAYFAVLNAEDEQRAEEAELAAETETTTTTPAGGPVQLAADPSAIEFTTTSLQAQAGNVTIDFDNPNPAIAHDVCVQAGSGPPQCSKQVTDGKTTLDLKNLKPGSYTFYCSVDGHEEAGMKGTLTVQ
jgi:plastocyanin